MSVLEPGILHLAAPCTTTIQGQMRDVQVDLTPDSVSIDFKGVGSTKGISGRLDQDQSAIAYAMSHIPLAYSFADASQAALQCALQIPQGGVGLRKLGEAFKK